MNEAGALRIKIAYDDPNAKDALEIQEESYSVVAKRFGFAGWRDNTISMIMDFAMNMDFGM
jgi:hypothetical protein